MWVTLPSRFMNPSDDSSLLNSPEPKYFNKFGSFFGYGCRETCNRSYPLAKCLLLHESFYKTVSAIKSLDFFCVFFFSLFYYQQNFNPGPLGDIASTKKSIWIGLDQSMALAVSDQF